MSERARAVVLADTAATRGVGRALGALLRLGDVIALCGPLGAGKTTFTQGLAAGLGVPDSVAVRSPTFALCNEYRGRLPVLHLDFYRLGDDDELTDLGLRDRLGEDCVAAVEWADLRPRLLPAHAIWILLTHCGDHRRLTVWEQGVDIGWIEAISVPGPGGVTSWEAVPIPIDRPSASSA